MPPCRICPERMPSAIANKILRNAGWNFFSRLIHIPVSICLIPFIIDRVGAEWYGIWVTLFALVDYFSLLDLGIGAATIKYVAEYYATQNIPRIGHVILNTCIFNLIYFPPLLLSWIFANEILAFFNIAAENRAETHFIFDWILLNFALSQFSSVFRNTLIGLQRMHVSNFCEIVYLLRVCRRDLDRFRQRRGFERNGRGAVWSAVRDRGHAGGLRSSGNASTEAGRGRH